jgi:ribonuclease J
MQIIIHRGTKEIGGSCVEVRSANSRILVDFGIPLVTEESKPFDSNLLKGKTIQELKSKGTLPDIKGLYKGNDKSIDGILLTHSHLDHYGFLQYVNPQIPIYLSQGANLLIEASNIFIPTNVGKLNARIIKHRKKFNSGDFTITPFLVDHSAFDAHAFLIESKGKRLFYSGDFRAHGRKGILFKQMVEKPPKNIDCLVMEGSALGREDGLYKTEEEVEKRLVEVLRERKNITFMFASAQNIDRIVSAYRACIRTGSIFVIDVYAAFILDKLKKVSSGIPQFDWNNVRVKFAPNHYKSLEKAGLKKLLYVYKRRKIEMTEINQEKNKILMFMRYNSAFPLLLNKIKDVAGAKIAYSMWDGYLTEEIKEFCKNKGIIIEHIHTSGHAAPNDLKAFAKALKPRMLVPIHTFHADKYKELFDNVQLSKDGEMLEI